MDFLLRIIGSLCLGFCMTYWHPCKTGMEWVLLALFWIGLVLFVDSE